MASPSPFIAKCCEKEEANRVLGVRMCLGTHASVGGAVRDRLTYRLKPGCDTSGPYLVAGIHPDGNTLLFEPLDELFSLYPYEPSSLYSFSVNLCFVIRVVRERPFPVVDLLPVLLEKGAQPRQ